MNKPTKNLDAVLKDLTRAARDMGLNDTEWAAQAGLRKETLCRLRRWGNCNLRTLLALASAVDMHLGAANIVQSDLTPDGHFPVELNRDYEERLLGLCASHSLSPQRWAAMGPGFFMAGLAVMLASVYGFDRPALLALGELLHPGASDSEVFARWLQRSPVRPSRFLPMLDMAAKHAA